MNRELNMIPVSRRIEMGALTMAAERKKAAYMFLTKNNTVNCLRKLYIDDHPAMPVASLANLKLNPLFLQIITQLPRLKYLRLSPDMCQDKEDKFSDFMEELEKNGCEIKLHYTYL